MSQLEHIKILISILQVLGLLAIFIAPKSRKGLVAVLAGILPVIRMYMPPVTTLDQFAAAAGIIMIFLGIWLSFVVRKHDGGSQSG
jgi:hypothetical protein